MLHELIALHPVAFASISAQALLVAAAMAIPLVAHCALLVTSLDDYAAAPWLRYLCLVRIVAALPRPLLWYRIYRLHAEARAQPTPLRVAQRCLAAEKARSVRLNDALGRGYNYWLALLLVRLFWGFLVAGEARCDFERRLCRHALLCVGSMVLSVVHISCHLFTCLLYTSPSPRDS